MHLEKIGTVLMTMLALTTVACASAPPDEGSETAQDALYTRPKKPDADCCAVGANICCCTYPNFCVIEDKATCRCVDPTEPPAPRGGVYAR